MKKKLITAFLTVLGLYIAVCIVLSYLISVPVDGVNKWAILRHRAPFVLLEAFDVTVIDDDGDLCAYDAFSNYITYWEFKPGDTVRTVFVFNPFTNYTDDTILRIDHNPATNDLHIWY